MIFYKKTTKCCAQRGSNNKLIAALVLFGNLIFFSNSASAFVVWAVEGGAGPESNSSRGVLSILPGEQIIDLFFSTQGNASNGWVVLLKTVGDATVESLVKLDLSDVVNDSNPRLDGFSVEGGDDTLDAGLATDATMLFSFLYKSSAGSELRIEDNNMSLFVDRDFSDAFISGLLIETTEVPIPAAAFMMLSALMSLRLFKK